MRGRSLGSASSIVPCSAESATRLATTPSGIGTAASLLVAFFPASMTMRVAVRCVLMALECCGQQAHYVVDLLHRVRVYRTFHLLLGGVLRLVQKRVQSRSKPKSKCVWSTSEQQQSVVAIDDVVIRRSGDGDTERHEVGNRAVDLVFWPRSRR